MIAAIIQARVGSTRLPNKVFADIVGKPLLWHICNRLKYSKKIDKIVIATTTNDNDNIIEDWAIENNIPVYRGSEDNVLERFYETAKYFEVSNIVRITADDPFKDPQIIDKVIELFFEKKLDFAFNNHPPTFPEGLDTEVFSFNALEVANNKSKKSFEKEHVTQYFYLNPQMFKLGNFAYKKNLSYLRWTIDTDKDLEMARAVYEKLYNENSIFFMNDILELINKFPNISKINKNVERSMMYKKQGNSK